MKSWLTIAVLLICCSSALANPIHEKIFFDQADNILYLSVAHELEATTADGQVEKRLEWSILSGFIFRDKDGVWVLTAGHLKHDGPGVTLKKVVAYFRPLNRPPTELEMVGYDHLEDVALLKFIDPKAADGLAGVKLGSSAVLKGGQDIVSIGYPYPLYDWTAAAGRINNLIAGPNDVFSGSDQPELIVHDGLINGGNSGSPIFNMNGEVVGINVMLYPGSTGVNPLTFSVPLFNIFSVAIPIDDVTRLLPFLKKAKGGEVKHGPTQIRFEYSNRLHESDLKGLQITKPPRVSGIMVTEVAKDSLAKKVGFKPGDIVLSCNNRPIKNLIEFYRTLYLETDLKKKFDLKINRDGIEMTLPLLLSDPNPAPKPPDDSDQPAVAPKPGNEEKPRKRRLRPLYI